jgi:hypothetical protein
LLSAIVQVREASFEKREAPQRVKRHSSSDVSRFTNDVVSAAERVERFLEALANAGENRRIAQRVA